MFFALSPKTPDFPDESDLRTVLVARGHLSWLDHSSSSTRNAEGLRGAGRVSRDSSPNAVPPVVGNAGVGLGAVVLATCCIETRKFPIGRVIPSSRRFRYQRFPSKRTPAVLPASTRDQYSVPRARTAWIGSTEASQIWRSTAFERPMLSRGAGEAGLVGAWVGGRDHGLKSAFCPHLGDIPTDGPP